MHALDLASVPQWANVNNLWFPASVDTNCPYCAKLVNFTPTYHQYDTHRKTISSTASCPACNQVVYLWVINPGPALDPAKKGCSCLAIYPAPRLPRQPIKGIELLPHRVGKAYHDMLGVFNARVWSATGTCCRRTLETMMAQLQAKADANQPLAERIQQLNRTADLARPLNVLAHAVRSGGKLSGHFDLEQEPDPATAQSMLDLMESVLQYLYVGPAMIEMLDAKLEAAASKDKARQPATVILPKAG